VEDRVAMKGGPVYRECITLARQIYSSLAARQHLQDQDLVQQCPCDQIGYHTGTLYTKDEKKLHATSSRTAGEWFSHFILWNKIRTGQMPHQNEAFTSDIIVACCK
jgi:hypothetical protein